MAHPWPAGTLGGLFALTPDDKIDLKETKALLQRIGKIIHQASNRVRYTMNGYVIAAGGYVAALTAPTLAVAQKIGVVKVNLGNTECKVPFAPDYIKKMVDKGQLGKKKKTLKC